ncbi:MAG: polysaccharide biosynthesis tyrosine autokinase [Planctomycetales bacterium]|nr:polysaccharide biosynthesis tyrosine autokinase [Planctomycetales bacterium]
MSDSPHDPGKRDSRQIVPTGSDALSTEAAWVPPAQMWLDAGQSGEGINLFAFLHSLRRRWVPAALLGLLVALLTGGLLWFLVPDTRTAEGIIRVKRSVTPILAPDGPRVNNDQEFKVFKQTQAAMIKSPFVLLDVLRLPEINQLDMVKSQDRRELAWLQRDLNATFSGDSELMRVSLEGKGEEPKLIVDAVMKNYLEEVADSERREKTQRLDMLTIRKQENMRKIIEGVEEYERLAADVGTTDSDQARIRHELERAKLEKMSDRSEMVFRQLQDLEHQLYLGSIAVQLRRKYEPNPGLLDMEVERDPFVMQQMQELFQIEDQLTQLAGVTTGDSPIVQQLQSQKIAIEQKIAKRRKVIAPRIVEVMKERDGYNDVADPTQLTLLKYEYDRYRKMYEQMQTAIEDQLEIVRNMAGASADLVQRRDELKALRATTGEMFEAIDRIRLSLDSDDRVELIQPATIADEQGSRIRLIGIGVASLGMMVMTMFGIAMWDYLGKHLNSTDDVEKTLRLRVLGTLPSMRASGMSRMVGGGVTETMIADCIDSVRASINYGGGVVKSVVVTSAVGREGKTTVASQLAVSMARSGKRTLLIDGDIRNPQQHAVFGLPPERGLCEVLRGEVKLEEVIQSTPAESLWILPAGHCDFASIQALAGQGAANIMDWCREQFDHVVIDSGPVLVGAEAMIYGQHVDGAVLCSRRDTSRLPKIEEATRRLQSVGVRVLGVVVNGETAEVRPTQLSLMKS